MQNPVRATSPAIKATVFLGIATLLVAGCASKKSSSNTTPSSAAAVTSAAVTSAAAASAPGSSASVAPAVAAATSPGSVAPALGVSVDVTAGPLGKYLTDSAGKTLYIFTPDTSSASTCYGTCVANWPAFVTDGTPQAGAGATASLLGTSPRTDGTTQVTYNGHPLYLFKGDKSAGDTSGQGKAGTWFMVSGSGAKIASATTAPAPKKPAPPAPTAVAPPTSGPPSPSNPY